MLAKSVEMASVLFEQRNQELDIQVPRASMRDAPVVQVPAPKAVPTKARRVLIVDDNEDAADLLADALRAAGHTVTVAHDIGLPVMDGYELAAQLRKSAPACRFVALTGYGQDHDFAQSRDAGFETHFVKPIDIDKLLSIVGA